MSIKVVIDARLFPGPHGGVETVVLGLAQGLSCLDLAGLDISFLCYEGATDWLADYVGKQVRLETQPPPGAFDHVRKACRLWAIRRSDSSFGVLPRRDRIFEALGADVVHFPTQSGRRVTMPFIYQPH